MCIQRAEHPVGAQNTLLCSFLDVVLHLPYLPTRNIGDLAFLSHQYSGDPHYHEFTHISPLLVFYLQEISACTIPLAIAHGSKGIFPALDQTEQRSRRVHRRMPTGRDTARSASPLCTLRPDMKGLFREMQGVVIRAFLLLIMVLP